MMDREYKEFLQELIDLLKRQVKIQRKHIELLEGGWHNATLRVLRLRMKLNEDAVVDKVIERIEECEFLDNKDWEI